MNYICLFIFSVLLYSCSKPSSETEDVHPTDSTTTIDSALSIHEIETLNWLKASQLNNGLLQSAENSNHVSLYDNALAALVFIAYEEYDYAENILNHFNNRIETELKKGNGGFSQFRDSTGKENNHRWMGDNAWLLIALNNYKHCTGNNTYNVMAQELTNWLIGLQDVDGGVWGGYKADDEKIHKITEGNIDAFNAVFGYTDFHKNLLHWLEAERWDVNDKNLIAWPGNQKYKYALDLHAWGYCIFNDFTQQTLINADKYLCTMYNEPSNTTINGFCFDEDKDVVWLEGTGEMIVAYQSANFVDRADYYIEQLETLFIESTLYEDAKGLPYASNLATGYGSGQLWEGVNTNIAISACAWYLFAKHKFDPFAIQRNKSIPEEDKFWK